MASCDLPTCSDCGDSGWRLVNERAMRCSCRFPAHVRMLTELSGIPPRYETASFASYRLEGPQEVFSGAYWWTRSFAQKYPASKERGALLIGTIGAGKTHLGISMLRELLGHGIACRFYDYCSLLREIQASYSPQSEESAMALLAPAMETEILLLDDFGAMKPSPWVMETVTLLLNTRYNQRRATILTTNFSDAASAAVKANEFSLQDRVGERVVSRLREMCRFIAMEGPDYRLTMHAPGPRLELAS